MRRTISKDIFKIKIFTETFVKTEKNTSNFCKMQGAQNVFLLHPLEKLRKRKRNKLN